MNAAERLRRRLSLRRARAEQQNAAPSEELVEEALLVVASAVRLAAKNQLILRVLRDRADFDEDEVLEAIRGEIRSLLAERTDEATRLSTERRRARLRFGWATRHDDYRRQDRPVLKQREAVSSRLSERLSELAEDDAHLRSILDGARESALDEIIGARLMLQEPSPHDSRYAAERESRMASVRRELDQLVRLEQLARSGH